MAEAGPSNALDPIRQDPTLLYDFERCIGKGSYGKVYRAIAKSDGQPVAFKVMPLEEGEDALSAEIERELLSLRDCSDSRVVQYFAAYIQENRLWIAMECCLCSTQGVMRAGQEHLQEDEIAAVCAEALRGLMYLHKVKQIIHRDVKAANILLTERAEVKLADFGVSARLSGTLTKRNTVIGTPMWMSPEMIEAGQYDHRTDIWSLGITAIELAQMEPPLFDVTPAVRVLFLIPSRPAPTLQEPSKWSPEFNEFVSRCLSKDPALRPDAKGALESAFAANAEGSGQPVLQRVVARYMASSFKDSRNAAGGTFGTFGHTLRCDDTCGGRSAQGTMPRGIVSDDLPACCGGTLLSKATVARRASAPPESAPRGAIAPDDTTVPSEDVLAATRRMLRGEEATPRSGQRTYVRDMASTLYTGTVWAGGSGSSDYAMEAEMGVDELHDALESFSFMADYDRSGDEESQPSTPHGSSKSDDTFGVTRKVVVPPGSPPKKPADGTSALGCASLQLPSPALSAGSESTDAKDAKAPGSAVSRLPDTPPGTLHWGAQPVLPISPSLLGLPELEANDDADRHNTLPPGPIAWSCEGAVDGSPSPPSPDTTENNRSRRSTSGTFVRIASRKLGLLSPQKSSK